MVSRDKWSSSCCDARGRGEGVRAHTRLSACSIHPAPRSLTRCVGRQTSYQRQQTSIIIRDDDPPAGLIRGRTRIRVPKLTPLSGSGVMTPDGRSTQEITSTCSMPVQSASFETGNGNTTEAQAQLPILASCRKPSVSDRRNGAGKSPGFTPDVVLYIVLPPFS